MSATPISRRRLSTGLFEIDLNACEVHKSGRKLPMQEQPFRVLAMLLERTGEVVTREELQARLWPADTYVGFDEGINTAIRKLRLAFGDSAENPRFIETVPRRGYRFIAPLSITPRADSPLEPASEASSAPTSTGDGEGPPPETDRQEEDASLRTPASRVLGWPLALRTSVAVALVFILASVGYLIRSRSSPYSPSRRVMLAVLPFNNLSGDANQEYIADGLTEETITDLGQLSPAEMGVIARTSAMAYKHTDKTVSQIGHELEVDYVLEGSIRSEGGKARVSAQLIRVSDQTHLWAKNYDRDLHDLLNIENELGQTIAQQVQVNLSPQRRMELAKMRTVDPEAYDLYLKGRYYWNQRTPAGVKESIAYYQQAIAKDPDFAQAYAGLADAYYFGNILWVYAPKDCFPQAREAATKAIMLDPKLAEAYAALAMVQSHYDFDFPAAEKNFLKALELNPNSAYAHLFYGNSYLLPMGRVQEAIAENKKALELDPLSLPINNFMAMTYSFAGDYDQSYKQFQHTIQMDPTFPLAHMYLFGLLTAMGRYEEAIHEYETGHVLRGVKPEEAAAEAKAMLDAYNSGGATGFWRRELEMSLQARKRGDERVYASEIASLYALSGEKDKAFEWLNKAYEERDGMDIALLKCDPAYKDMHGDPRFAAMLSRMGLPE